MPRTYLVDLAGVRVVQADGVELVASDTVNFTGGLSATYDPATRTITVDGQGAGGPSTPGSGNVDDGINDGDVPMWESSLGRYVPVPFTGLAISSFALATPMVEVGQTASTPAFSAAYGGVTPDTAVLTDNQGTAAKDVISSPLSFASNASFTKNTFNAQVVFTLAVELGPLSQSRTVTLAWGQKTYYGVGAAGLSIVSFLALTPASQLKTTRAASFSLTPAAQKIYVLIRTGYGTPAFTDTGTGFSLSMTKTVSAQSVTNGHAFAENYDLWESVNLLTPGPSGVIAVGIT